jgi:hypothetical protein
MITINELEKKIADLETTMRDLPSIESKKRSAALFALSFMRQCIRFLETDPSETVIKKQLSDVELKIKTHQTRIMQIQKRYPNPAAAKTEIATYSKNYDLKHLFGYQTTLRFILGLSDKK